jgi:hypothetical protein
MTDTRVQEAVALMNRFAERTGLTTGAPPQRYLWTDAFAVCNYLGLAHSTGDPHYTELALQLVDQVHHTLGWHREDDKRTGWISGLDEADGELHPTRGGLRIGKPLPERSPDEPRNEHTEWDRDGQYFHYLTRWMHALDQVARDTHQSRFNAWARDLSYRAADAFTYQPASEWQPPRMVWKMSIDLTRVLVPSMGQHDPLDGYITNLQLRSTMADLSQPAAGPDLEAESGQFAAMLKWGDWTTTDPLGLGGLMMDAYRLQQVRQPGSTMDAQLLEKLLGAAITGLQQYARSSALQQPAPYRLAFRELGLSIGLHAMVRMHATLDDAAHTDAMSTSLRDRLDTLLQYLPLSDEIEAFWRNPEHQRTASWNDHQDINEVMLATSLAPDGFLVLQPM